MSASVLDVGGNPFSGTTEAAARVDQTVDLLLAYDPDLLGAIETLATEDADVPMAQALLAYLSLMTTDIPDLEGARACAQALDALPKNEREIAHSAAIDAWLDGRWRESAAILDELLVRRPTDMIALLMGHLLDFFTGDARNLRDRIGHSLLSFDPDHDRTAFVRGLQAFGLEESGHYGAAEAAGLAALHAHPRDVWAVHAVVHCYEMQGEVDTGIGFMRSRESEWGSGNLFTVHLWWHLALYLLEAGREHDALAIYDAELHNEGSTGVTLEMLDASALLWRLTLDGIDSGNRYQQLATAWEGQLFDEPWYAFNDLHGVVALCGAERLEDARTVIGRLERFADAPPDGPGTRRTMIADVGLPGARAVLAFAEGRHDDVVRELLPRRTMFQHFGGSHAQRDLLQRTLTESAIASGHLDLARALVDERLSLRDTSVYGLVRRARVLALQGDERGAKDAEARAEAQRSRFSAAA